MWIQVDTGLVGNPFRKMSISFVLMDTHRFLPIVLHGNASNSFRFETIITNVILFARYNSTIGLQVVLQM